MTSHNKVALVTGASRGIGRGIAVALGEKGWTVVVNYRGNESAADETVRLVGQTGGSGGTAQANIGSSDDRERLHDEVMTRYGRIDLLVNNAGMGPRKRVNILETTEESFDEVMDVNLKGPFFLAQRVARTMIRLLDEGVIESAYIVNMGSISAYTSSPERGEYCISKAGLGMVTSLFADYLAQYGIGVYEIRPGIIETDMTSTVTDKYDRLILEEGITPIKRWGLPRDVGLAVAAIAEGEFPFSTGEIFNVDGGFHLHRL